MDATIDLVRLMRAVHLDAEPTGHADTFWVARGERRHFVDYRKETCDCADFQQHGGLCKHLLSVALHMGERTVLRRLRWLIPNPDGRRYRPKVAA